MSPELSPQEIRGKKVQFVTAMRPSMIHVFSDGCLRARTKDLSSMLVEEGMTRLCDTGEGGLLDLASRIGVKKELGSFIMPAFGVVIILEE